MLLVMTVQPLQSICTRAALTTPPQQTKSDASIWRNSSGVLPSTCMPAFSSRSRTERSFSARFTSALSLPTRAGGVLAGTNRLVHKVRPMFEQRALDVSEDVMFKWRLLVEDEQGRAYLFAA